MCEIDITPPDGSRRFNKHNSLSLNTWTQNKTRTPSTLALGFPFHAKQTPLITIAAICAGRRMYIHSPEANVFFQPPENNMLFLSLSLSLRYLPTLQGRDSLGVVGWKGKTYGNTRWLVLQSVVCRPDQATDLVLIDSRNSHARARHSEPESCDTCFFSNAFFFLDRLYYWLKWKRIDFVINYHSFFQFLSLWVFLTQFRHLDCSGGLYTYFLNL